MNNEASTAQAVPTGDKNVSVGLDGWLFLTGGDRRVLDLYSQPSSFTERMAEQWVEVIRARTERMNERGIDYFHLVAPDKLSVFSDKFNGDLANSNGNPVSQLVERHAQHLHSLVNLVDYFRQGAAKGSSLYWKTSSLWSCWGAYAAYQMLMHRLGDPLNDELLSYPYVEETAVLDLGVSVSPEVSEDIRTYNFERYGTRRFANEVVRLKDAHDLHGEPMLNMGSHVIYENRSASAVDKIVVIFGDAYSGDQQHLLTGMLAETYREVHFIWSASIDDDYVKSVKPDIVITEMAEADMLDIPADDLNIAVFAKEAVRSFMDTDPDLSAPPKLKLAVNPNWQQGVFVPETYQLDPPVTVQPACMNNCNDKFMETTHVTMDQIDNPKVYLTGDRCLVLDSAGEVAVRMAVDDDRATRIGTEHYRKLNGTALLLGNSAGANCYYHWMLDLLPKIGLMERMGISVDSVDYFLVRELTHQFQIETLERFGIDRSRVIETKKKSYWQPEKLIHFHMQHGINMKMNRFIPAWLNHTWPGTGKRSAGRRLYVSRPEGVRRGITNEDEFRPILEAAGFEFVVMEGLSVAEQASLMADVDVLMSPHGGALTNMVFCRPGTKIVEIFGRHVYPYYFGLANLCGHRYYTILEDPTDYPRVVNYDIATEFGTTEIQHKTMSLSFGVSPGLLERMIKKLDD